jgi:hypothetical protein
LPITDSDYWSQNVYGVFFVSFTLNEEILK